MFPCGNYARSNCVPISDADSVAACRLRSSTVRSDAPHLSLFSNASAATGASPPAGAAATAPRTPPPGPRWLLLIESKASESVGGGGGRRRLDRRVLDTGRWWTCGRRRAGGRSRCCCGRSCRAGRGGVMAGKLRHERRVGGVRSPGRRACRRGGRGARWREAAGKPRRNMRTSPRLRRRSRGRGIGSGIESPVSSFRRLPRRAASSAPDLLRAAVVPPLAEHVEAGGRGDAALAAPAGLVGGSGGQPCGGAHTGGR
jgi:hypothetical protein